MRNPVTVLTTLLSVEFVMYTICLCSPQWLVWRDGANQGLFAFCRAYGGFSSCTASPAWTGSYSLTWMFLSTSSLLSLTALLTTRPALNKGKKAIIALLLNISSAALCASTLITFLMSIKHHKLEWLWQHLGSTFYTCCATFIYASLVSILLGVVRDDSSRVEPALRGGVDISVIAS